MMRGKDGWLPALAWMPHEFQRGDAKAARVRAVSTPTYPAFCKRVLIDNGYFETVLRPCSAPRRHGEAAREYLIAPDWVSGGRAALTPFVAAMAGGRLQIARYLFLWGFNTHQAAKRTAAHPDGPGPLSPMDAAERGGHDRRGLRAQPRRAWRRWAAAGHERRIFWRQWPRQPGKKGAGSVPLRQLAAFRAGSWQPTAGSCRQVSESCRQVSESGRQAGF